MRKLAGLTSAFVLVAAVALGQDVSYNYDQQADFGKYKSYKWVEVKGGEQVDQLLMQQIRDAFDKNLATKGLTKATGDTADLFVAVQVAVSQEKQMTTWDTGYGMGPGWGGRWSGRYYGGGGMSTSTTSTIYVGSVALDMYDAADKKLVWRGIASKQVDTKAKPEKRVKNLDKGTAKMLKDFPPKPKT